MDYKIVEKPAFNIVGKSVRVATKDGNNFVQIPEFWQQSSQDGTVPKLASLASPDGVVGGAVLGVCLDFAADMSEFSYMIAVEGTEADGFTPASIPAATWAIFESKGPLPDAIQNVWTFVFAEFFPNAPYVHGAAPDLELYPKGDVGSPTYICEVWVPVTPK